MNRPAVTESLQRQIVGRLTKPDDHVNALLGRESFQLRGKFACCREWQRHY
jgi:hypothetical protein